MPPSRAPPYIDMQMAPDEEQVAPPPPRRKQPERGDELGEANVRYALLSCATSMVVRSASITSRLARKGTCWT